MCAFVPHESCYEYCISLIEEGGAEEAVDETAAGTGLIFVAIVTHTERMGRNVHICTSVYVN